MVMIPLISRSFERVLALVDRQLRAKELFYTLSFKRNVKRVLKSFFSVSEIFFYYYLNNILISFYINSISQTHKGVSEHRALVNK